MNTLNACIDGLMVAIMIASCYLLIKNMVTSWHRQLIIDAIHDYHIDVIYHYDYRTGYATFQVDYKDMESYGKTILRFWDWSYKRILPKDKFAIIEPYLKKD